MSDSATYPLSNSGFQKLQTGLVPMLQSSGCTNVQFSGGQSGSISFHYDIPTSDGNFAMNYSYNPQASQLNVEITNSPWVVSNSVILADLGNRISRFDSSALVA